METAQVDVEVGLAKHAGGKADNSSDDAAPWARQAAVRTLMPRHFGAFSHETLYDENFVQRLHKGLPSGHRDMPNFHFDWDNATDAVNYLKSIQEHREVQVAVAAPLPFS